MAHPRTNRDKLKNDPFRDEFPTSPELAKEIVDDIEGKVDGMTIYCPCDSPESNIYKELKSRFAQLGLKHLTSTSYCKDGHGFKTTFDGVNEVIEPTEQDGSFDSPQSRQILEQSDVVVTNPPFSRIIDFFDIIKGHKFISVVSNMFMCRVVAHFIDFFMSEIIGKTLYMQCPINSTLKHKYDDRRARVNLLSTFPLKLQSFTPFKKYDDLIAQGKAHYIDNYDNILCVDRIKDIPCDYDGLVAAPVNVLNMNIEGLTYLKLMQAASKQYDNKSMYILQRCIVNGKHKFTRILMKKDISR